MAIRDSVNILVQDIGTVVSSGERFVFVLSRHEPVVDGSMMAIRLQLERLHEQVGQLANRVMVDQFADRDASTGARARRRRRDNQASAPALAREEILV